MALVEWAGHGAGGKGQRSYWRHEGQGEGENDAAGGGSEWIGHSGSGGAVIPSGHADWTDILIPRWGAVGAGAR